MVCCDFHKFMKICSKYPNISPGDAWGIDIHKNIANVLRYAVVLIVMRKVVENYINSQSNEHTNNT